MNEPADDRMHEWLRQTMHAYEAPDSPTNDWLRVRRELRRTRRLRWAGTAGAALLLACLFGWWWLSSVEGEAPQPLTLVGKSISSGNERSSTGRETNSKIPLSLNPSVQKTPRQLRGQPNKRRVTEPTQNHVASEQAFVIRLVIGPLPRAVSELKTASQFANRPLSVPVFGPDELAIRQQWQTKEFGTDSTAYRALLRNAAQWPESVVVCDLTSSMYPYSTQVGVWLEKQTQQKQWRGRAVVQGIVFFTDCDSAGQETRPGGPAGQFFVNTQLDRASLLAVVVQASRHTLLNRFPPENDLEALLFAQQQFPNAKNLILLADNGSPVKDMDKLGLLTKPVRVILAGETTDSTQAFRPDYERIARQTGGSLHTIDDDLDPTRPDHTPVLRVGGRYYRYSARRKTYRLTRFGHRPERLLGPIWW